MFRQLGAPEIILILLVVLLLFGAKRLPDTARGLGRSLRIFKSEVKAAQDDDVDPKQITASADDVVDTEPTQTAPKQTSEPTER